ncbi:MAG: Zn-ribbon domain-containing OB-fold protein [Gemmobacter sp.]
MSASYSDMGVADPTTEAFWQACAERRLILQRCRTCGAHQHYPRPFCLACDGQAMDWAPASGTGTIYALTVIRLPVIPELPPPYQLALIDLDEGVRMLTNIDGLTARIGDHVALHWRDRDGGLPPLPVFRVAP